MGEGGREWRNTGRRAQRLSARRRVGALRPTHWPGSCRQASERRGQESGRACVPSKGGRLVQSTCCPRCGARGTAQERGAGFQVGRGEGWTGRAAVGGHASCVGPLEPPQYVTVMDKMWPVIGSCGQADSQAPGRAAEWVAVAW